jgi:hypothetical protein
VTGRDERHVVVWASEPGTVDGCVEVDDGDSRTYWRHRDTHVFGDGNPLYELESLEDGRIVLATVDDAPWMRWPIATVACAVEGCWHAADPRTGRCYEHPV